MRHFLAVDQGGSKTEAIIFREDGAILAFEDDRDIRLPGESYAQKQGAWIRAAAEKALRACGIDRRDLSGASCALNGADWPEDYIRLQKLVSAELSMQEENILIVNDCIGAMRGGASSGNRAVICAGSGANCAVHAAGGEEHVFSYFVTPLDQGGGALGTQVWQRILDAHNGWGAKTLLTDLLLEKHGAADLTSLYMKFTTNQILFKNYDLCPLLMRAAKKQDPVALEILEVAAKRMLHYIEQGIAQLNLTDTTVSLVLTGGVFKGDGHVFFDRIHRTVQEKGLNVVCVPGIYEPVAGTALLLLDQIQATDTAVQDKFSACAEEFGLIQNKLQ